MNASERRRIHIVGLHSLHNELMASCLQKKTGALCFVDEGLEKVPCDSGEGLAGKRLILYDCLGKTPEELLKMLQSDSRKDLMGDHLVLFDLNSHLGIEKDALDNGVSGFLYECDGVDTLLKMIESVFGGEMWVSRKVMMECLQSKGAGMVPAETTPSGLTTREIDILALVATGHTNEMMADRLCISPHTVKTHLYRIFKKINVANRIQAAHWASQHLHYEKGSM